MASEQPTKDDSTPSTGLLPQLILWYSSIPSIRLDIHGDFAGSELFLVQGDALVRHVLTSAATERAAVDMDGGFQILHAIAIVEEFLANLRKRGCKFQVVFFDSYKQISVPPPPISNSQNRYKYMIARECILKHLLYKAENDHSERSVYIFKSPHDEEFDAFLSKQRPYFILCHDHAVSSGDSVKQDAASETDSKPINETEQFTFLSFIWHVMEMGYTVGLVNEVEFLDAKVFTHVLPPWEIEQNAAQFLNLSATSPILGKFSPQITLDLQPLLTKSTMKDPNTRDTLALLTLASIQLSSHSCKNVVSKYAASYLLHIALLPYLSLAQRHLPSVIFHDEDEVEVAEFLKTLGEVMLDLLNDEGICVELRKLSGGFGDLVDGRLFRNILAGIEGKDLNELVEQCSQEAKVHYEALKTGLLELTEQQFPFNESPLGLRSTISKSSSPPKTDNFEVLPFSNPVFASHLKDLDLSIDSTPHPQTRYEKTLYQTSLSGAAMRRLKRIDAGPTENYRPSEKKKWWQLRGEQIYQADMQRYALSLSGSGGVGLTPERIITASPSDRKKAEIVVTPAATSEKKEPTGKSKNAKSNPKTGGKSTSSKAAEIIAANAAAKAAKAGKKAPDIWKQFYTTEVASSRTERAKVVVLTDFIQRSADENFTVEARLLKCSYLFNVWRDEYSSATHRPKEGYEIVALLFSEATKITTSSALTKQIKAHLDALFVALGFAPLTVPAGAPALPSKPPTITPPPVPTGGAALKTRVGMGLLEFQLQYCGPYMDRNLDSSEDSRVRFKPDKWQVNVLDALDADKSVFVVAPTSAGKTFIAYYAMEKTIRISDDDVLVYVAPTKALVNQIAAELQARFVKDYPKQPGKTIWAIHTGDYKVHNPQKCQILVTVPHILQIMLLSPALATTWAPRVKRIILDEIHCIGQSEDGAVWEQLLLLAPCPIIALSATVGNPGEFHQWLQVTQAGLQWKAASEKNEKKGVDVVMIHNKHRFNNLRIFNYHGLPDSTNRPFEGLEQPKVYSLGLADLESSSTFRHLHPVAALGDDAGSGIPEDLELEARDCYSLYKAMEKAQTANHPLPAKLTPGKEWFPEVIKKADVIIWEGELKKVLKEWMVNAKSQFLDVVSSLRADETILSPKQEPLVDDPVSRSRDQDVKVGTDAEKEAEEAGESNQPPVVAEQISAKQEKTIKETLDLLSKLHTLNALPALLFSYERSMCDTLCSRLVKQLGENEKRWRESSKEWKRKVAEKELYLKRKEEADRKSGKVKKVVKKKAGEDEQDDFKEQKEMDHRGDDASAAIAAFDPDAPSEQFSFAGKRNISKEDLEIDLAKLKRAEVADEFIEGLRRGVGIHHAGLPRPLRECVERLFRKGYLRVVIATGTLSLGINMPCCTVVFVTDNVSLTPLNFRQASGRAGRRGFDLLGNVVFHGLPNERTRRLINSNLPSLMGHFPTSTTLILRLFILLHGSNNAPHAISSINALLSQTRLSLAGGSEDFRDQVIHHIRFSIEYLRRMSLLSATGEPTNFAALAAHLYYTEPSNFLFNALIREGVFHNICAPLSVLGKDNVDSETVTQQVYKNLMVVLAHIFGRVPYRKSDDVESLKGGSQSMVLLPDLPKDVAEVWNKHNEESLKVFTKYVVTYAAQKNNKKDGNSLPYSYTKIDSKQETPTPSFLQPLDPVHARSPFVALSGYTDEFYSITQLESTCRDDILLESSGVPYIPGTGIRLNAYLYDFLQHGNLNELVVVNRIRNSEVWFMLNDFSQVLATIVTVLKNLLSVGPEGEMRMGQVAAGRGVGEDLLEEVERLAAADADAGSGAATTSTAAKTSTTGKKKAKANWFDEDAGDLTKTGSPAAGRSPGLDEEEDDEEEDLYEDGSEGDTERQALLKVLKGFLGLQQEFNNKFRAIFATKKDAARARKKLQEAQRAANPTMEKEKKPKLRLR